MKLHLLLLKILPIRMFLFVLPIIFTAIESADCAEETFYSIHVASFKKLQNANNFVNTMNRKGKILFWEKTDVPGKGMYYRVYLGKYETRDKAVEFWNILNEEGSVGYFGIYAFGEEALSEPKDEPPEIPVSGEEDLVQASIPVQPEERFVDNGDGTVTDKKTNLMWIKNGWRIDFFSAVNWRDASEKCKSFQYGGYTDWRLPSIQEWKSLMDKNNEFPALVEPNPFENIIVHMPYWSNTELNSGRSGSLESTTTRAYTVMLYYGRISHQNINKLAFILPVRSLN